MKRVTLTQREKQALKAFRKRLKLPARRPAAGKGRTDERDEDLDGRDERPGALLAGSGGPAQRSGTEGRQVTMIDFEVSGSGSVYLLTPNTDAAREWVSDNLPGDVQRLGNGIAVEHRYIGNIVEGIVSDGLGVAFD